MKYPSLIVLFVLLLPLTTVGQELQSTKYLFTDSHYQHISGDKSVSDGHTVELSDFTPNILSQDAFDSKENNGFIRHFQTKPGIALLSSAIIPGSGQLANENWVRAGFFLAAEITTIYFISDFNRKAERRERNYERFADGNWSVAQYANWLIDYHDTNGINNPFIEDLRSEMQGVDATFDTEHDWEAVNISLLRNVERNAPYITPDNLTANNFSHVLPDYGSQQYYELISKYFQYQAGWKDFNMDTFKIDRNGALASPLFFEGVNQADQFNNNYRSAGNLTMLLIANHVVSAFDAFFSVTLRQNRIKASSGVLPGEQVKVRLNF